MTEKREKNVLIALPLDLVKQLEREAELNHRSRTKQVVAILEERYTAMDSPRAVVGATHPAEAIRR